MKDECSNQQPEFDSSNRQLRRKDSNRSIRVDPARKAYSDPSFMCGLAVAITIQGSK